jgi:hypothetical protein
MSDAAWCLTKLVRLNSTRSQSTTAAFSGAAWDSFKTFFSPRDKDMVARAVLGSETFCRHFVDTHFAVFSSVQKLVWVKDETAPAGDDFFSTDLQECSKEIMWGYRQWCDLLNPKH